MSVQRITAPYSNDGRLNILVVDDMAGGTLPLPTNELDPRLGDDSRPFSPWMSITLIGELDDIGQLENRPVASNQLDELRQGPRPFDVYILDYRLCDSQDHCKDMSHQLNGSHHPAAGLLAGVLAAQKWPHHVQALIPWSAYTGDAVGFWAVYSRVQADSLTITDPGKINKTTDNNLQLVLHRHAAPTFRAALKRGLIDGKVAMPMGEYERVTGLLHDGDDWIDAETTIGYSTAEGLRDFKLGSLFFDLKKRISGRPSVPVNAVRELVGSVQRSDPIYQRARQLAELFWMLRMTDLSHQYYAAIRHNRMPEFETTMPWIGHHMWRLSRTERNRDGIRSLRLAILFLLLFEYRLRLNAAKLTDGMFDEKSFGVLRYLDHAYHTQDIDSLGEFMNDSAEAAEVLPTIEKIKKMNESIRAKGIASALDLVTLQLPLTECDIVQLFDPLPAPSGGEYASSLAKGSKIRAGLERLLDGEAIGAPGRTLAIATLPLCDVRAARAMLLEEEWLHVSRFARELLATEELPTWLSDQGRS